MLEQEWEERAKGFGFKSGAELEAFFIANIGKAWSDPQPDQDIEHEHYGA